MVLLAPRRVALGLQVPYREYLAEILLLVQQA
ncbi:hypothetical protein MPNT_350018 [Candidatus Methylacidithermus pantelleriae]|uniref:Uncharacterized protein n=1 Tax=Candidatus Methylacidithermus pantelleriae TaxID=2744239 RepID=A0A8J2BMW6_9BACT|nr:hypothetical protein MPNT_350018 [Candidatus Methylacidithermus pantelleriae]